MIYPSVACTLLIPVAPHSLANRPIVIPENSLPIEITVTDMRDATLYFDMQDNSEVLVGDIIKASPYPHRVKILHPSRHNDSDTLCERTYIGTTFPRTDNLSCALFTEHSRLCHR